MGYVERNLVPGENLVYKTGRHWIVMLWPLVGGFVLAAVGFVLLAGGWMGTKKGGSYPEMIGVWLAGPVSGLLVVAGGMIRRTATEVGVSSKRVLIKTGLLSQRSIEVLLPKVESIGVDESAFGRMLGYGTMIVRGTGGTF